MTADHTRAMRRLHAVAKAYGIDHELISAWADDVHHAESTRDVPAHELDALAKQMEAEGDEFAAIFIDTYGPKSIMQFRLLDVPEDSNIDRFTA